MDGVVTLDSGVFPIGPVWVVATDRGILRVIISDIDRDALIGQLRASSPGVVVSRQGRTGQRFLEELEAYFSGGLTSFSSPPLWRGTPFQESVWRQMHSIPYGTTRTYGEIAAALGLPRACRAVGRAAAANPLPILVPCHRVVAQHGLGGYSSGRWVKQWLIEHEQRSRPTERQRDNEH